MIPFNSVIAQAEKVMPLIGEGNGSCLSRIDFFNHLNVIYKSEYLMNGV